jgi:hypothetical protein
LQTSSEAPIRLLSELIASLAAWNLIATRQPAEPTNSAFCGNAWVNGNNNDEVFLGDDPNFNPASVFNENWSPFQHVQPTP